MSFTGNLEFVTPARTFSGVAANALSGLPLLWSAQRFYSLLLIAAKRCLARQGKLGVAMSILRGLRGVVPVVYAHLLRHLAIFVCKPPLYF